MTQTLADCLARKRNDLAAVRMLAATAVLWAHARVVTESGLTTADFPHVFAFSPDFHGVHAFFILSGMLLTRSILDRPDAIRFVTARFVRYVPAIFVSALFAAIVLGPAATTATLSDYLSLDLPGFVLAVSSLYDVNATLPGVFADQPKPSILYVPLWTIHYELVFALCLAALGIAGLLRIRPLVAAGFAGTMAAATFWFWNGEEHLALGSIHHMFRFCTTFGIGIALGVFADRVPVSGRVLLVVAAIAAPLAFTHFAAVAGFALLAYAIVWIGFAGGPVFGALAKLGVWSYGFYVWGFLVEQTIVWLIPGLGQWSVFLAAFPISLLAGWLSWRFVEQPTIARTNALSDAMKRLLGVSKAPEVNPSPARMTATTDAPPGS